MAEEKGPTYLVGSLFARTCTFTKAGNTRRSLNHAQRELRYTSHKSRRYLWFD